MSGLTKQDYITRRLLGRGGDRPGKSPGIQALREQLVAVWEELRRIEAGEKMDQELLEVIQMIAVILDGMKEESAYGN